MENVGYIFFGVETELDLKEYMEKRLSEDDWEELFDRFDISRDMDSYEIFDLMKDKDEIQRISYDVFEIKFLGEFTGDEVMLQGHDDTCFIAAICYGIDSESIKWEKDMEEIDKGVQDEILKLRDAGIQVTKPHILTCATIV